MNYASILPLDIANGSGIRVSVFVSGCTHHCNGCFNQSAWDFEYGEPFTEDTIQYIISLMRKEQITGLTVLGGEPFEPANQPAVAELLRRVRTEYPEKSLWAYTGYLYEDIAGGKVGDPETAREILSLLDVLVDGPFVEELKDLSLVFRGSSNQRIIDLESTSEGSVVLWTDKS